MLDTNYVTNWRFKRRFLQLAEVLITYKYIDDEQLEKAKVLFGINTVTYHYDMFTHFQLLHTWVVWLLKLKYNRTINVPKFEMINRGNCTCKSINTILEFLKSDYQLKINK